MKIAIFMGSLFLSTQLWAVCEDVKLNLTDTIYQGFICTPTEVVGADKIEKLCFIRAETLEEDGVVYRYTNMQARASNEDGWSNLFSTFKWHHKKNDSVSKMWESDNRVKMKDVTPTDFMAANIYKTAEFSKKTKELEIEVYKKKSLIGIKKYKWYSAFFTCEQFK